MLWACEAKTISIRVYRLQSQRPHDQVSSGVKGQNIIGLASVLELGDAVWVPSLCRGPVEAAVPGCAVLSGLCSEPS